MQVKKYHSYIIIITRVKTKYRVVHITTISKNACGLVGSLPANKKGIKCTNTYYLNACLTGLKTVHYARIKSKLEPRYFFHPWVPCLRHTRITAFLLTWLICFFVLCVTSEIQ